LFVQFYKYFTKCSARPQIALNLLIDTRAQLYANDTTLKLGYTMRRYTELAEVVTPRYCVII